MKIGEKVNLDKLGQVWVILGKFGQVRTISGKFGQVWASLGKLRQGNKLEKWENKNLSGY